VNIRHVPLQELAAQASALQREIEPAILDGDTDAVWSAIRSGRYVVFRIVDGEASAMLVASVYEEGHTAVTCFGIEFFTARKAPRHRWLALMRCGVAEIGKLAKEAGCTELRLGGRDWRRVFPDFTPLEGVPHGLRKVL